MRYRAVISYFGHNYVGWQRQLNGVSVQQKVEEAMKKVFGVPTQATASGRTDAGVHALGQAIHFDVETSIPTDKIPFAVNTALPDDISMLSCEEADENFNARFSAKKKTYRYSLYLCRHRLPMLEPFAEHIVQPLDLEAMRMAADKIEGTHDFKCFEATGSVVKNTVRTVYEIGIDYCPLEGVKSVSTVSEDAPTQLNLEGEFVMDCRIDITVTGNGFLYNMVRIIAGTLVYAGLHKLSAADVESALKIGDRTLVGKTLPAKGLCLLQVMYD